MISDSTALRNVRFGALLQCCHAGEHSGQPQNFRCGGAAHFSIAGEVPFGPLALDHIGQKAAENHGIDDAGVHALAARRAMHVGCVTHQEESAFAVGFGDTVMDAEARTPDHLLNAVLAGGGPARIEQSLNIGNAGLLRRVVEGGDNAERAIGQRRHDNHTGWREEK